MLRNLLTWNRRRRKWNTEHESAWRGVSVHSGEDRLSPFQRDCEGALESALSGIGCQLVERVVEMPAGNEYIAAKVASTDVRVWIHDDTAASMRLRAAAGSKSGIIAHLRTSLPTSASMSCVHRDLRPNER
jgi:hypothetical protein